MKKLFTTMICFLFVLSLSSFSSAQIPQLQLQMPEVQQMGQTGQLGRGDEFEPKDTAVQSNDTLGNSDMASANNFARETTAQVALCEDGSSAMQVFCSVSDDLLTVECFEQPSASPSIPFISFTPGSTITFFRPFSSHSFLVASEDGLSIFNTMTGEETEISVSPISPTDIKGYVRATNPVSGSITELILTNDNTVHLRQGDDPTAEFSVLITNSTNNLIGIDYFLFNSDNFLGVLTDIGTVLLADIADPKWLPAADVSSDFASSSFSPGTNGFSIRALADAISLSIVDENQEWVMNIILPRQDAQAGEQQPEPLVSLEKASPQVLNACMAETEQRQLAEECPEGLILVEAVSGISCVCPDGRDPHYAIGSKDPVCPEAETETVTECLEGELTLVDNEYKCIVEAECEEGSYLTTDPSGEEYCLWPTLCPSGFALTTLSDGTQVCSMPAFSAAPTTLMIDSADAIPAPIAEGVINSPSGDAEVSGGAFSFSCQMAGGSGSPVDLFFLIVGLWGFVRYYARSRF